MLRLFVGLVLPEEIRRPLAELRRAMAGTRWITPDNLHLTLRFIGEVDVGQAADIDDALLGLRENCFDLQIHSVGQFGSSQGPRILWAGIAPCAELVRLAHEIDRLLETQTDIARRAERFRPHITLARLRDAPAGRVAEFLAAEAEFAPPLIRIETVALFSSRLAPDGAGYRLEAEYPLRLTG